MAIHFGQNLKFLRKNKGENQSQVASVVQKAETTIGNWEKGISQPNLQELSALAQYFGVSVDNLINVDFEKSNLITLDDEGKKRQKSNLIGNPKSNLIGKNAPPIPPANELPAGYETRHIPRIVTVNEQGIDNILYVPMKARAGYLLGYGDPEFMETLPSFRMPGLNHGTYRMFEVEGISMSPTLSDKDRVICEWVPSFAEIRENRVHVVVHAGGVAIKRVLNRVKERNKIYLKSDTVTHRQDYPIMEIDPADVREIWYVRMAVTSDLREPSELYTRMSDLEIHMHEILKKMGMESSPKKVGPKDQTG
jgi:transcriptional regulator with XRE-family HTH domain